MKYDISFIGLGKLGLPLATNFAKRGKQVLAIDINSSLVEKLQQTLEPWYEEGLKVNIEEARENINYTTSYEEIPESNTTIILVNTPSKEKDGSFSNEYVVDSLTKACKQLKASGKQSHNFILSSTVMPGSVYGEFIPLIENITGWTLGKEFNFSYVPDFVAIGSVIRDFHEPDFVLVGANTREVAHETFMLYACMLKNAPPTSYISIKEAELAKVALNAYITTKISFANYLGLLAERLDPEINVDNITQAIGQDKRIGSKYFKAGGPYGGTCFPRDTWAFLKVSDKVGLGAMQMNANEYINNATLNNIADKVKTFRKVGLVGLGFKPGTAVHTQGVASQLVKLESLKGIEFYVHDVFQDAMNAFSNIDNVIPVAELQDLYENVQAVIFCNGDKSYDTSAIPTDIKVVDPWRII